jgi:hypothetical protein
MVEKQIHKGSQPISGLYRVFSGFFMTSQGPNRDITGTSQGPHRDKVPVMSGLGPCQVLIRY